jgi:recombination protein RecA
MVLADDVSHSAVTEWIPTGFRNVDRILGGGIPVGKFIEIFGPEASGKSALAHRCIAGVQSIGGLPMVEDYEFALDPGVIAQQKINPNVLIYSNPPSLEAGWNLFDNVLEKRRAEFRVAEEKGTASPPVFLGVMDSLAAGQTCVEERGKVGDTPVAPAAKINSQGFRRIVRKIGKWRASIIFVNQERVPIGRIGPFVEKITPGGETAKYYCTMRLRVTRVKTFKAGDVATGYLCQVLTRKNRHAPPHQRAVFVLDFTRGPSPELTALYLLREAGVVRSVRMKPAPARRSEVVLVRSVSSLSATWWKAFTADEWCERMQSDSAFADERWAEALACLDRRAAVSEEDAGGAGGVEDGSPP